MAIGGALHPQTAMNPNPMEYPTMSPHAVNNFVSDLVLMAQAMERLPQVEAELAKAHADIAHFADVEERTRADLAQSRDYAASLEQRIHDLEVARDDAELRFLEADERTGRALDFIKATFGNAGSLIQALEPPKAAPQADSVPLSEPIRDHFDIPHGNPVGERESPLSVSMDPNTAGAPTPNVSSLDDASWTGQREPDPTSVGTLKDDLSGSVQGLVTTGDTASTTEPLPSGPYSGRRYIDVPGWVSREDWLAGGGTNEDYDWRP